MRAVQYGFCLPVFANPGHALFRAPAWAELDPADAVDAAVEAEALGYDSLWVADHLMHGHDGGILEGWTTLAYLAGKTSRAKLGTIHLAQAFRPPQIAAKQAATLDALSRGRLLFFYDFGYVEAEAEAYGLDLPPADVRTAQIDEGLDLIDRLWRADEPLEFEGRFFRTKSALCRPRPAQRPRPPIWLGEARDNAWCDVVARRADGWNSAPASLTRLAEKLATLHAACRRHGRDPQTLDLSLEIQILVAPSDAEARAALREIAALPPSPRGRRHPSLDRLDDAPLTDLFPEWLIGSPESVRAQIAAYRDLGVSHLMLWFVDFPSRRGLRLFAETCLRPSSPSSYNSSLPHSPSENQL
jgi:alkanesulfonate monooxygenase SsuD/methylene tetrahydromethanopterin reductase-like flavin-dependent oxidoreductase (luciferase family)